MDTPSVPTKRGLDDLVRDEALLWGDSATEIYFEPAARNMDVQWTNYIWPFLSKFPIDYTHTVELSCGHGRNSEKLAERATTLTLVDVNSENIAFCQKKFAGRNFNYVVNNGYDFTGVPDGSATFFYCFDSAVHFDIEIVISYIKDFQRILAPGAYGFMHHSNDTRTPGLDFRQHPEWRNFMSKEVFKHVCIRNGLAIVDQHVLNWGQPKKFPNTDCFSLFRKPVPGEVELTKPTKQTGLLSRLLKAFR